MKTNRKLYATLFSILMLILSMPATAQNYWKNYNPNPFGLHIGYASKQWVTDFGLYKVKENLWGKEGKHLKGMQFGMTYHPITRFGLGAYTGLSFEIYMSSGSTLGFDHFSEISGYLPIHASYTIPVGTRSDITVHGGLGLNYAFHGGFYDDDDYYYDEYGERRYYDDVSLRYGHDGWPERFNASLELGAQLRIKSLTLGATYSWGQTSHRLYSEGPHLESNQNKLAITLGWVIDSGW